MAESDLVHIGSFVKDWTAILSDTDLDSTNDAVNSTSTNIPDDIAEELKVVCGCVNIFSNIAHQSSFSSSSNVPITWMVCPCSNVGYTIIIIVLKC
jgi:hypothetical protein